ncbi:hypothetical protein HYR99_29390, partial [Candidatus Poribacteria bacterium]|nr:hypothetical protein [Candidatus Poribacteria bacterium]
ADINNILDFERDYPNTTVLRLEQNYRSTQNILEAAYEVVRNNRRRKEKKLWTDNSVGDRIICYEATDENDEAGNLAPLRTPSGTRIFRIRLWEASDSMNGWKSKT